ncbi:MAG: 16S rRNA (cytosine(1402)-N(4))-methyltransferase RsmH [Phototrophicales bacterium]
MDVPHVSVLLEPIVDFLRNATRLIDGTLGAGGHTYALLQAGVGHVLGLDLDTQAIQIAQHHLHLFSGRVTIQHGSYVDMKQHAAALGWDQVDGILLDLGVSSMQLDTPERGFAFMKPGPLDMRFDQNAMQASAADIVNTWTEDELTDIFFRYGEERFSRQIARAIIRNRPFETTTQLATLIEKSVPRHKKGNHPATRVFQALRIAVNNELAHIERTLPDAIDLLRPGGRLAVISFHSLEDRIVKHIFKAASTEVVSPPGMMLQEKRATIKLLTRKPIVADEQEIHLNPRSRSAKLRIVEKL